MSCGAEGGRGEGARIAGSVRVEIALALLAHSLLEPDRTRLVVMEEDHAVVDR